MSIVEMDALMTDRLVDAKEHNLGQIEQIPLGEGREFAVEGRRVTVFRPRPGGTYATQAECPHRQGPLADGLVGGLTVVCPFHAWKFDLSSGLPILGACGLTTHTVRVTDAGEIVLTLTPEPDMFESMPEQAEPCKTSS